MDITKSIRTFQIVTTRATWPWTFEAKLVFSYLCYADAIAPSGLPVARIATETQLNWRTVKRSLEELRAPNLVAEHEMLWRAQPPEGDTLKHFPKQTPNDKHWSMRLNSYHFFVPGTDLRIRSAAVYSLLYDLGRRKNGVIKGTCDAHLATLTGLSAKTIKVCRDDLEGKGLLQIFRGNRTFYAVMLSAITDEQLSLFARPGKAGLVEYDGLDDAIASRDGTVRMYEHADTEMLYQSLIATSMTKDQALDIMKMFFYARNKGVIQEDQFKQLISRKSKFAESQFRKGAGPKHPAFLLKSHLDKLVGEKESATCNTSSCSFEELMNMIKCKRNQLYDAIRPLEAVAKASCDDKGDHEDFCEYVRRLKWDLAVKVAKKLDNDGDLTFESFRREIEQIARDNGVA